MVCLHVAQSLSEHFLKCFTMRTLGPEARPKEWGQYFFQLGVFKCKQKELDILNNRGYIALPEYMSRRSSLPPVEGFPDNPFSPILALFCLMRQEFLSSTHIMFTPPGNPFSAFPKIRLDRFFL